MQVRVRRYAPEQVGSACSNSRRTGPVRQASAARVLVSKSRANCTFGNAASPRTVDGSPNASRFRFSSGISSVAPSRATTRKPECLDPRSSRFARGTTEFLERCRSESGPGAGNRGLARNPHRNLRSDNAKPVREATKDLAR